MQLLFVRIFYLFNSFDFPVIKPDSTQFVCRKRGEGGRRSFADSEEWQKYETIFYRSARFLETGQKWISFYC